MISNNAIVSFARCLSYGCISIISHIPYYMVRTRTHTHTYTHTLRLGCLFAHLISCTSSVQRKQIAVELFFYFETQLTGSEQVYLRRMDHFNSPLPSRLAFHSIPFPSPSLSSTHLTSPHHIDPSNVLVGYSIYSYVCT